MPSTVINISAVANGGSTSAVGVLVSGFNPSDVLTLTLPPGQLYTGASGWPSDDSTLPPKPDEGEYWGNGFVVTGGPGSAVGSGDARSTVFGSITGYPNGEAARAAFPGGTITGFSEYTFWYNDTNPSDNRGGLSVRLTWSSVSNLPEIQMPAGIQFSRQPYETEPEAAYIDVPTMTGHWRKRRVFLTTPRVILVEAFVTPLQAAAFDTWFEQTLKAGQEEFTARLQKLGAGMEYWAVRFFSSGEDEPPYRAEAINGGYWRISATLRTSGEASTTPPVLTTMGAEIAVPLEAGFSPDFNYNLEAEILAPLFAGQKATFEAEILAPLETLALEADVLGVRITEDLQTRITETGDIRIIEASSSASITEGATATDTTDATVITATSVSESVSAADTTTAAITFASAISESASAVDATDVASGLLDSYTTSLWGAVGLSRLKALYAGPCLRVRRSSDNSEQDIGFSGTYLDTSALLSFVGANDGFVVTWYDQSGGGHHLSQATAAAQPQIVYAGVFYGYVMFDGVDDAITSANLTAGGNKNSIYYVGRIRGWKQVQATTQQGSYIWGTWDGSVVQHGANQGHDVNIGGNQANTNCFFGGTAGGTKGRFFQAYPAQNIAMAHVEDMTQATLADQLKIFRDGSAAPASYFDDSASSGTFAAQAIHLGGLVHSTTPTYTRYAAQSFVWYEGAAHSSVDVAAISALLQPYHGTPTAINTLDSYQTNITGLYSLRKLRSAYAGSCLRVRRSSDNAEQDIGFTAGGLIDSAAMLTFVGANNGFVTTWYDQSAAANHLVQTTAANQPQIVSSGVYLGWVQFDGSNDIMSQTTASSGANTAFTSYIQCQTRSDAGPEYTMACHGTGATVDMAQTWQTLGSGSIICGFNGISGGNAVPWYYTPAAGQVLAVKGKYGAASAALALQTYNGGKLMTPDTNTNTGTPGGSAIASHKWHIGGRSDNTKFVPGNYFGFAMYEDEHSDATVDAISAIVG